MEKKHDFTIRIGCAEDVPSALDLIQELAIYEKAPHEVEVTIDSMTRDGFGTQPLYKMWYLQKDYMFHQSTKTQICYHNLLILCHRGLG